MEYRKLKGIGLRSVVIKRIEDHYLVSFYYDNLPDYEWKRGSAGLAVDTCSTYKQAERKGLYYINKDKEEIV